MRSIDFMTRVALLSALGLCAAPVFAQYAPDHAMSPGTMSATKASNYVARNGFVAQNKEPGVRAVMGEGRWNLDKGCATELNSSAGATAGHPPSVRAMMGEGRWNLDRDPNCLYG